jgi:hypothetical protein
MYQPKLSVNLTLITPKIVIGELSRVKFFVFLSLDFYVFSAEHYYEKRRVLKIVV